ncbi:MAG TPA: 50S ribosomal protein L11 methyltransferase [Gammaproteobacteria bacterium]|nr:50S ribosomal protein L11 methyltransferase [Gammaproteobacteria bacterium]
MFQLKFEVNKSAAELLSEQLSEAGALAVTLQDSGDEPLYEPALGETALWSGNNVVALFETQNDVDIALAQLRKLCGEDKLPAFVIEELKDKVWERAWMDDFHPIRFGSRLWIVPSWTDAPDPEAVNILLDPGLAFGTGTHPTTALCLSFLDQIDLTDQQVVDYGCGSGVLAIAAAKLGAKQIVAIDHDSQALEATVDNAQKNSVQTRIVVRLPEEAEVELVDIMIANILAGPLIDLAAELASRVKIGGKIALSGILSEQAEAVTKAYSPWFDIKPAVQKEGWVLLFGDRK